MWYRFQTMLALAAGMGLLTVVAGCTEGNGREGPGQGMTKEGYGQSVAKNGASRAGLPAAPAEASRQVTIDNFTFDPPTLTVPAGTKVTWVNRDDVPHTATSTAKPKSFDSGPLDTDQQFTHVFTQPGTYDYFCAVHPKMVGRIVVE